MNDKHLQNNVMYELYTFQKSYVFVCAMWPISQRELLSLMHRRHVRLQV